MPPEIIPYKSLTSAPPPGKQKIGTPLAPRIAFVIILLAIALAVGRWGCSLFEGEHATESFAFPSGEVITNESYLSYGRDSVRHNRLYFQQTASSPRERLGETIAEGAPAMSLHEAAPKLLRSGDRVSLVIGPEVFQRWPQKGGPVWYQMSTHPDSVASNFLRSFLAPDDRRAAASYVSFSIESEFPYAFHDFDLTQTILTTRRAFSDTTFPEFLVYSATRYGFGLRFDVERTRAANHLAPPPDSGIVIDFSTVTYPGELGFSQSRDAVLAMQGAREIHAETHPLSSSSWTGIQYLFTTPAGASITDHFDALLACRDPLPDRLSIVWRQHPVLWDDWHDVRLGEWVSADATGYNGGLARIVFFRVRRDENALGR